MSRLFCVVNFPLSLWAPTTLIFTLRAISLTGCLTIIAKKSIFWRAFIVGGEMRRLLRVLYEQKKDYIEWLFSVSDNRKEDNK